MLLRKILRWILPVYIEKFCGFDKRLGNQNRGDQKALMASGLRPSCAVEIAAWGVACPASPSSPSTPSKSRAGGALEVFAETNWTEKVRRFAGNPVVGPGRCVDPSHSMQTSISGACGMIGEAAMPRTRRGAGRGGEGHEYANLPESAHAMRRHHMSRMKCISIARRTFSM